MALLPAILFCAAVVLLLFGTPWWSIRRAMRREGLAPCLNHLETQAAFARISWIGITLIILVGALMAARQSAVPPLILIGLFVLSGTAVGAFGMVATLLPAAWELNRALALMIRTGTRPPEPFVGAIRRSLARTRWLQAPLFWLHGISRDQLDELLSE